MKHLDVPFGVQEIQPKDRLVATAAKKFSVSNQCITTGIAGTTANQYAVHIDEKTLSGNKRRLIQVAIDDLASRGVSIEQTVGLGDK